MEKGSGGSGLLGWTGLLGLIVGVGVGAALGYFELVRRTEMHDVSLRMHHLQAEINLLRNMTEQLQKQIQAQEKRIEEEKSPQYYDDNTDYYDDDSYDDYRDGEDPDSTVQDSLGSKNRTRRTLLEDLLHGAHERAKRAVQSGSDKYNLVISQGARRPSANRASDVKAVIIVDPHKGHVRPPTAVGPYPPSQHRTTRKPRIYQPGRPTNNYEEHVYEEERIQRDSCCSAVAAHFAANSTRFRHGHGHRSRYEANHRMAHYAGMFKDWTPYAWSGDYRANFNMEDGNLTVYTPGLYFIYAQIYYADPHDMSGFRIYVNKELLFQCSFTSITSSEKMKRNSCYTGGLATLQNQDSIRLVEVEGERYSVFEHTKSFFGLFRVAGI